MMIELPDQWLKSLINAHPDTPILDALKIYMWDRSIYSSKHIIFAIGERALHELVLQA